MCSNRIQKLLFSEYSDLEDIVLVEGPFAETDRQGKGIRQVQIGLTPTKLILASYFVEPVAVEELGDQWRPRRGQDPDIESFELVSAYPVECVNLSVYRHRRRQTLKARFSNGNVVYFEIGGWQERKMLWSVWCERIKFLSPYESGTSVSETSVGSSSSGSSSLYIARSSLSVTQTGKPTLWCHYACTEGNLQGSWVDPHLYLGPTYYEKGVNSSTLPDCEEVKHYGPSSKQRFPVRKQTKRQSKESLILSTTHEVLAAEVVETWESSRHATARVRRRYAVCPCPYALAGFGPWRISKPMACSVQVKKNASVIDLREDAEEFRSSVPKGCLVRTTSLETLVLPEATQGGLAPRANHHPRDDLSFWTRFPEELLQWEHAQYKAQQRILRATRKTTAPHIFGIRDKKKYNRKQNRSKTNCQNMLIRQNKNSEGGIDVCGGGGDSLQPRLLYSSVKEEGEEGWLLPISRFKSSSLAHQLTMVHKQLFLQVDILDLARAHSDMSSWRAPSLRALVYFSHRVSCVAANHILLEHDVQKRARVIGRLMSTAYKCHRLHNMMSAEAVLRGLHSPPVYRLHRTWAFVRKHHANNYRKFEDLSRRYFDCREPLFQKTYDDIVKVPPFLPTISLLVAVLLGSLPELPQVQSFKFSTERCRQTKTALQPSASAASVSSSVKRFLSALQITSPPPTPAPPQPAACETQSHLHTTSRETLLEHLDQFFAPVSDAPAHKILQDLQYFLECHQTAATRYQIPVNPRVRAFLLYSRHPDMRALYRQSLLIEP